MIDPKLVSGAAGLVAVNSEAGKKLLVPLAEQIGLSLSTIGDIWNFYLKRNLERLFIEWAASRRNPLTEEDILKVMPLLQLASVQSDEELQKRWVALLESTVKATTGVLPSFGPTLSQLTAEEARYLDRLFALVSQPKDHVSEYPPGRAPLGYITLINVYDPSIDTGINSTEWEVFREKMPTAQLNNYDKLAQAELVIHDLERLGIIRHNPSLEPDYIMLGTNEIPIQRGNTVLRSNYSFTQYGVSFIRAVSVSR